MGQAKTFTGLEIEQLRVYATIQSYAAPNRAMVLMAFWAGLRLGELAHLRFGDVFDAHRLPRALSS